MVVSELVLMVVSGIGVVSTTVSITDSDVSIGEVSIISSVDSSSVSRYFSIFSVSFPFSEVFSFVSSFVFLFIEKDGNFIPSFFASSRDSLDGSLFSPIKRLIIGTRTMVLIIAVVTTVIRMIRIFSFFIFFHLLKINNQRLPAILLEGNHTI